MGKKRIVTKTEKELLAEREKIETSIKKEPKSKISSKVKKGRIYISSSYNNTLMSLTDMKGNVIFWVSAGSLGFKGTKKGTPFAASKTAEALVQRMSKTGIQEVEVYIKGIGVGRSSALKTLANQGIEISLIKDITPIPHNGCRPPKPRHV